MKYAANMVMGGDIAGFASIGGSIAWTMFKK
jgi:hypothetical protein